MISAPVILDSEQQSYLDQHILGYDFPWFYFTEQTRFDPLPVHQGLPLANVPFWAHTLIHPSQSHLEDGQVNSGYWPYFLAVFQSWMALQGIPVARIYRSSVNLVHHQVPGSLYTVPHYDHTFPHWNWLWYLDTVDHSETLVFDVYGKIVNSSPCHRGQAVVFDGSEHAHRLPPDHQLRRVVVVTFSPGDQWIAKGLPTSTPL